MDNKKDIAHVLYSGLGGTTDYVFNLIEGDKEKKYRHHIFFFGIEDVNEETLEKATSIADNVHITKKRKGLDRQALRRVTLAITASKPVAVTCHVNSLILPLSTLAKNFCKLIFVEHQANHLKSRKEKIWSIFAQRKADCVVSLTPEYQKRLEALVGRFYKAKKNVLIRSGIALNRYYNVKPENEHIRIGMVSRINEFRDHNTLLQAFSKLAHKNISLHIAGDGPLKEKLEAKFKRENIHWHGVLNQEHIAAFLAGIDIYVHASKGETSSMAIMQAMASKLPIIASDVAGIRNVFNDNNGILVEVQNAKELQKALDKLIDDADERNRLAIEALSYAQRNCNNERMFNQFDELL
ncbi:MAG: glycosyltransferase family 4 protein [Crocinitomicaceae bacterium]